MSELEKEWTTASENMQKLINSFVYQYGSSWICGKLSKKADVSPVEAEMMQMRSHHAGGNSFKTLMMRTIRHHFLIRLVVLGMVVIKLLVLVVVMDGFDHHSWTDRTILWFPIDLCLLCFSLRCSSNSVKQKVSFL